MARLASRRSTSSSFWEALFSKATAIKSHQSMLNWMVSNAYRPLRCRSSCPFWFEWKYASTGRRSFFFFTSWSSSFLCLAKLNYSLLLGISFFSLAVWQLAFCLQCCGVMSVVNAANVSKRDSLSLWCAFSVLFLGCLSPVIFGLICGVCFLHQ